VFELSAKLKEKQDQELVIQAANGELDGKRQPDFLFAEADGTFVRGLKKRQHIEIKHFILYEGWVKNGEQRFLYRCASWLNRN
jgi:hypothetical protein